MGTHSSRNTYRFLLNVLGSFFGLLVSASTASVNTATILRDPTTMPSSLEWISLIALSILTGAITQLITVSFLQSYGPKGMQPYKIIPLKRLHTCPNTRSKKYRPAKDQKKNSRGIMSGLTQTQARFTHGNRNSHGCPTDQV